MLSLTVKKLDAFKFDGVAESDNTAKNFNTISTQSRLVHECEKSGPKRARHLTRGKVILLSIYNTVKYYKIDTIMWYITNKYIFKKFVRHAAKK